MTNNKLRICINNRIDQLLQLISEKKTALRTSPEGSLRICRSPSRIQYYHVTEKGDSCGKYIRKKDHDFACRLAQKSYDRTILDSAEQEVAALREASALLPDISVEELYSTLPDTRKAIVTPVCISDRQFVQEWLDMPYKKKAISEDLPEFYTDLGERVRSKSELIIANKLNYLGIPYKYECPLVLDANILIHPDFTVLNIKKRKVFYLEHLGRMDDPGYCEHALERIRLYQKNDIYPGESLILTHETEKSPLNSRELEQILKHYLL